MNKKRESRSRYIILGILNIRDASGYDIKQAINSSTSHFWDESLGQIYPTLETLYTEGFVLKKAEYEGRREKFIYSITDEGRKDLLRWLVRPCMKSMERNELLLKTFFTNKTSANLIFPHLEKASESARASVGHLSEILDNMRKQLPNPEDRIFIESTVRAGILAAEYEMRWCEETIQNIKSIFNFT